ncbi:LuxR family transcriptional regulator [Rhizobium leguminosarum]|nr:LuxR family transcriptional regulator [Rhizobium leguminosarum]NKK61554.1 LuxR family transcriptional regulator [Rhizobium leguminosarum bv. viciae]
MTHQWLLPAIPIFPSRILDETTSFILELESASTFDALIELLLKFVKPFGATNVLAGTIPSPGATKRQQLGHVLLNAWPNEWSARYFAKGYLFRDPTIRQIRYGRPIFDWRDLRANDGKESAWVMSEAAEFGLKNGVTLTLPTLENEPLGFSIAGDRLDLSPDDQRRLAVVATLATSRALKLREMNRNPAAFGLTDRERKTAECAANGLKEWQIAEQMGITRHGVDKHMRSLRQKLSAANTTEAVAKAIRLKLIC